MPFNIPKFADLKTAVSTLRGRYEAAHQVKNSQRFFGRWSSSAPNTDRLDDIGFIERLTKNVEENKFYYQSTINWEKEIQDSSCYRNTM